MTEISSLSLKGITLPQSGLLQAGNGDVGGGLLFGDNLIGGTEDTYASDDAVKQQLKIQAQSLISMAKRMNANQGSEETSESSGALKKSLNTKLKALKEQAEAAGINLNELFSEISAEMNMSRKDQKLISKTLKVKISKKTDIAQENSSNSTSQQSKPFGSTVSSRRPLFTGFIGVESQSSAQVSADAVGSSSSVVLSNGVRTGNVDAIKPWANDGNYNKSWWQQLGYNEEKGKQLLSNGKRWSDLAQSQGVKAQCGGYVRRALNDTYGTSFTRFGKACNTGDDYLSRMPQLKKIDVSGLHLKPTDIPPGAIVIYPPGYSSGAGTTCGHIEISDGQGSGYSDLKTHLLSNRGQRREPQEIWIPV
ncbi:hypothetical protein IJ818_04070 [bacterium]|nr:hypothetical protein [bacterium]